MKRIIKKLSFCLTAIILMAACTNNDDSESQEVSLDTLAGEWRLKGWQYEGQWHDIDPYIVGPNKFDMKILPDEATIFANSLNFRTTTFVNVSLSGDKIVFDTYLQGEVSSIIEEALFFDEHIVKIQSYQRNGSELRIYFSASDYFLYTNDFDDNTPVIDTKWYDGPNYPFVGTVNKVDAEKDEVEVSILVIPYTFLEASQSSVVLHYPGAQSICHFKFSEWADKTIVPGDRIYMYITSFQQTDNNEPNRTFNCHVKPYEEREVEVKLEGQVRYEEHLGWHIQLLYPPKTRYYPMKGLDEKYLQEGLQVFFTCYYYTIPINTGYYFMDLAQIGSKKEMFTWIDDQDWILGKWKYIDQKNTPDEEKMRPHVIEFKTGHEVNYIYENETRNNVYHFLDNAYYQTDLPVVSIPGGHGIPYVCHLDGNRLTLESRDIIAPGREHPLYVYERIE